MDDNANQALMIAFALFVFIIAITTTMRMFSQLNSTAEALTFSTDETNFYDNVAVVGTEGIERYVNTETVIPTLYRYYKENFCVKIYDTVGLAEGAETNNPVLVQILDVNLEGKVENAAKNTRIDGTKPEYYEAYSLNNIYNDKNNKLLYMFGVPWLGSTENMKLRIDYLLNGDSGYINNQYIDYRNHPLHKMIAKTKDADVGIYYQFKENFISYSYTGETMTTEDGDELVIGANSKDKIVITYTLIDLRKEEKYKNDPEYRNDIDKKIEELKNN